VGAELARAGAWVVQVWRGAVSEPESAATYVLRDKSGAYYQDSEHDGIVIGKKRDALRFTREEAEKQARILSRYGLTVEEVRR
jgi:hypothetical protein